MSRTALGGLAGSVGIAVAALSTASVVHGQQVVYVDGKAPAGGQGGSWQTAYNDLQAALLLAPRNGPRTEFRVAGGTYRPDLASGNRRFSFFVQQGDAIVGGYAGLSGPDPNDVDVDVYPTVLTGDLAGNDTGGMGNRSDNALRLVNIGVRSYSVASAQTLETLFRGLELRGGNAEDYSTLIESVSSVEKVTFVRCRIVDNRYWYLTDYYATDVRYYETDVQSNAVAYSGLRRVTDMYGCRVQGNWNTQPSATLISASGSGVKRIEKCLVTDNVGFSEVLYLSEGQGAAIHRCTFAGNTSVRYIIHSASNFSMHQNIVAMNTLDQETQYSVYPSVCVACSSSNIFGGNYLSSCSAGQRATIDATPFVDRDGPDNNPLTWVDNDYRPRVNGPAIDRAMLVESAWYRYSPNDVDGKPPFDVPTTVNAGSGASLFADVGAVEYVPDRGSPRCAADFNQSGQATVQDVFDFLTAYFNGCP